MSEIEQWLQDHVGGLERIAEERDVQPEVVMTVAVLVLAGMDDDEVLVQLRSSLLSQDGPTDPLAGASVVIGEVRALVAQD